MVILEGGYRLQELFCEILDIGHVPIEDREVASCRDAVFLASVWFWIVPSAKRLGLNLVLRKVDEGSGVHDCRCFFVSCTVSGSNGCNITMSQLSKVVVVVDCLNNFYELY